MTKRSTAFRFNCSVQGGQESTFCSYPVGLDPYRAGCGNDCLYCYVRHRLYDMGAWRATNPSILDVEHLRKLFEDVFVLGKTNSRSKKILATKIPLRIGMNTDPFQSLERELGITRTLLGILKEYKYPYVLLTKNQMVSDEKYLELYDPEISYIEVTITSLSKSLGRAIEKNASEPQERLDALRLLGELGIKTAARINPLFPIYPDGYYSEEKTKHSAKNLDFFSWELVHRICECKPSTVIVGFLRLDSEKTHRWMMNEGGLNLKEYFWKPPHKYYSRDEINYYYQECKKICDERGIAFSVCYDSDRNYEHFKGMWTNQQDCCNALGQTKYFDKTYRMLI